MGTSYNPKIITNGLILNLDAANRKSYPTTGTDWTDLTKNKKNGTLTNGVTYSSSNGGSLVFSSASSQYVSITGPISTATSNISMSAWFRTTNTTLSQMIFYNGSDLNGNGYGFSINNESTSNGRIRMLYGNVAWIDTAYTVSANIWYYGTMNIMSDGSNEFYINGVKVYTGISQTRYTPTLRADLGRNDFSGTYTRFLNGNIALAQFYNRVLIASEILQNYNATKGRFGL
jgi:hypothetical protein